MTGKVIMLGFNKVGEASPETAGTKLIENLSLFSQIPAKHIFSSFNRVLPYIV